MNHHATSHLGDYSWTELYPPGIYFLALIIGFVYFRWITRGKDNEMISSIWQRISMILALILLIVIHGTPIKIIGHHYLFSVHMGQMAIQYLMITPLIIFSIPSEKWVVWINKETILNSIFNFLTKPLVAILVFNALFSLYHIPLVFDASMEYPFLQYPYHFALLITSFTMWWPILCPVNELDTLSDIKKVGYIFANGVLMTPACALIMFAKDPLYEMYNHAPHVYWSMPRMEDQSVGGIAMKIFQEIVYGFVLGVIFFRWVKRERTKDKEELEMIKRQNHQLNPELK